MIFDWRRGRVGVGVLPICSAFHSGSPVGPGGGGRSAEAISQAEAITAEDIQVPDEWRQVVVRALDDALKLDDGGLRRKVQHLRDTLAASEETGVSAEYWQARDRCARCHQWRYGTDLYSRRGRPSTEGYCLVCWHDLDGPRQTGGLLARWPCS